MQITRRTITIPAALLLFSLNTACTTQPTQTNATSAAETPTTTVSLISPLSMKDGLSEEILYELLVAEFAGQRGELDLAAEAYLHLARELKDATLAERTTRIMIYARKDRKALEAAQLWTEYAPKNTEAQQILAAMYLRNNLPDQALVQIEKILKSDPEKTGSALQMLANFLNSDEDKATAMSVMDKLMQTRQNDPKAMFAYGLMTLRAGDVHKAREIIQKVTKLDPDEQNYQMVYLGILEQDTDKQTALAYLDNLLKENPDNFDLQLAHARMQAELGRFEEARQEFKKLTIAHPDNTDARYALALLNLQLNHAKQAKEQFQILIKKNVLVNESSFYMGQIAEFEKKYDAALKWFESVDPSSPQYFDAQIKSALMFVHLDDLEQAKQRLHQITPVNEDQQIQLIRVMADLLIEQKNYDDAMALYDQALSDKPNNDLLYSRAMLSEKMGRIDLLERDLRLVLDSDPNNADVLNALGYTLADNTERYEEAYQLIKRAHDLSPDNFYILDSMGWVLYRLGKLDEAVDYLRRAQALNPDPEISAHLSEVLWVKGDEQAARKVLQEALKTTPKDEKLLDVKKRFIP